MTPIQYILKRVKQPKNKSKKGLISKKDKTGKIRWYKKVKKLQRGGISETPQQKIQKYINNYNNIDPNDLDIREEYLLYPLNLIDMGLTELPDIPEPITAIDIGHNNFTQMPDIPNHITDVLMNHNKLEDFPVIKDHIKHIDISNNNISFISYNAMKSIIKYYKENHGNTEGYLYTDLTPFNGEIRFYDNPIYSILKEIIEVYKNKGENRALNKYASYLLVNSEPVKMMYKNKSHRLTLLGYMDVDISDKVSNELRIHKTDDVIKSLIDALNDINSSNVDKIANELINTKTKKGIEKGAILLQPPVSKAVAQFLGGKKKKYTKKK